VLVEDFTFTPVQRRALVCCLSAAGVAEAPAIAEIEQIVPTFRVLLASRGATRETAEQLRRLAEASARFVAVLGPPRVDDGPPRRDDPLDFPGRELLSETVMRRGYAPAFLTQLIKGHRILERALDLLNLERGKRLARAGAPVKAARAWLLRELAEILGRHHRPSRRKVLEALARHGLKAPAKARGLPVAECAAIVLKAIGQPAPASLPKVARRTAKNLPRNT
jgi:hypothetical protein